MDMGSEPPSFSRRFTDSLLKTAMIEEMALTDNRLGLDECLPETVKVLERYADAALRAVRRMERGHDLTAHHNVH